MTLREAARVIRSKNAGPLAVSIDLLFADRAGFDRAAQSPALAAGAIATLYGVPEGDVAVMPIAGALAIKISLPRPVVAGSPGDRDVYGAQQHVPLLGIVL